MVAVRSFLSLSLFVFVLGCAQRSGGVEITIDCKKKYRVDALEDLKINIVNGLKRDIRMVDGVLALDVGSAIKITENSMELIAREDLMLSEKLPQNGREYPNSRGDMPLLIVEAKHGTDNIGLPAAVYPEQWITIGPGKKKSFRISLKDYANFSGPGVYYVYATLNQNDFEGSIKNITSRIYRIRVSL